MRAFLFFNAYDLIALIPTTHNTFSSACLTHSLPSQVTAHIILLLLTPPSLPYHIKHTLIKLPLKTVPFWDLLLWSSWGREQLYPRWNRCWGKRAECETKLVGFLLGVSSCNKRKEYRRKRWNFNEADLRSLRDLDWLEIQHEMPRAKFRNLLSFEFVSDFFYILCECHRLRLSSQKNLPRSPLRTENCFSCEFRSSRIFEPHWKSRNAGYCCSR